MRKQKAKRVWVRADSDFLAGIPAARVSGAKKLVRIGPPRAAPRTTSRRASLLLPLLFMSSSPNASGARSPKFSPRSHEEHEEDTSIKKLSALRVFVVKQLVFYRCSASLLLALLFMSSSPNASAARNPKFSPRSHEEHKEETSIKKLRALRVFVVKQLVFYRCCWFVRH
jgi:hypothetical protein